MSMEGAAEFQDGDIRHCGANPHPEEDGHWWNEGQGKYWGDHRDNDYWCPGGKAPGN